MEMKKDDLKKVVGGIELMQEGMNHNLVGGKSPLTKEQKYAMGKIEDQYEGGGYRKMGYLPASSVSTHEYNAQVWLQGRGKKGAVLN